MRIPRKLKKKRKKLIQTEGFVPWLLRTQDTYIKTYRRSNRISTGALHWKEDGTAEFVEYYKNK